MSYKSKLAKNYVNIIDNVIRGKNCILYTKNDKYIDIVGGFGTMIYGHTNRELIKTLYNQSKKLTLTGRLYNTIVIEKWADIISNKFKYDKVIPLNTGTEAVECSIFLGFKHGYLNKNYKNPKILVFNGSFHGRTMGSISATFSKMKYREYRNTNNNIINCNFNDINDFNRLIENNEISAVLIELIQGEGGFNVSNPDFINYIRKTCYDKNILFIVDEIQTGMGRTGKYLLSDHYNIKPDITILGKGLGGGLIPISTVMGNNKHMDLITEGSYGSTFGGNPLACAVSIKTLTMLDDYIPNVNYINSILQKKLNNIKGKGLMIGLDVNNENIIDDLLKSKILSSITGKNTLRITPPFTINSKQINYVIDSIKNHLD